jgi:hypothetical protein
MTLEKAREIKNHAGLTYPAVCKAFGLDYSSFSRWLDRYKKERPVFGKPGPKKIKPFELDKLQQEVRELKHGKKRTAKTGHLYQKYAEFISRRDFMHIVSMARLDVNLDHKMNMRRIEWRAPCLVWSMDDTEIGRDLNGNKLFEHMVMDLGTRYKFPPVFGHQLKGCEVAANLEKVFKKYGFPLFIKRDNHGNLNSWEVNEVLKKYSVIHLNSPEYYSPYNGSIEKANGEFKERLLEKLEVANPASIGKHFQIYSETAVHDLNHKSRECLKGQNSCQKYFNARNIKIFYKRERRAIYDWIKSQTRSILDHMDIKDEFGKKFNSAWRIAAETWMRMKGFIFVSVNGKVLPNFSLGNYHN